jgi:hypothetical protein
MPPENIYEVENQRQQESVNSGNNNLNKTNNAESKGFVDNTPEAAKANELKEQLSTKGPQQMKQEMAERVAGEKSSSLQGGSMGDNMMQGSSKTSEGFSGGSDSTRNRPPQNPLLKDALSKLPEENQITAGQMLQTVNEARRHLLVPIFSDLNQAHWAPAIDTFNKSEGDELSAKTIIEIAKANIAPQHWKASLDQTVIRRRAGNDNKTAKFTYNTAEAAFGADMVNQHLSMFDHAHAFISNWAFGNILHEWKKWGDGTNFVSSLADGERLLKNAVRSDGISSLETALGVTPGKWSDNGKTNEIYRFIVKDPKKFEIRLPTGIEGQAYQNEWLFGGRTLGGTPEAIINAMSLEELKNNVSNGVIEIELVNFIGPGQAEKQKISSI